MHRLKVNNTEEKYLLISSDSTIAHCFVARIGGIAGAERLGEHHASLVSAGGLVYFLNDNGAILARCADD